MKLLNNVSPVGNIEEQLNLSENRSPIFTKIKGIEISIIFVTYGSVS